MKSPQYHRLILVAVGISLALRLGFVLTANPRLLADAKGYHDYAVHMEKTGELGDGASLPYAGRTPVYPAVLAVTYRAFGQSTRAVGCVQAVLGAITTLLIILLGSSVGGRRTGLLAGALHALSPHAVMYSAVVLQEVVAVMLLAGAMLAATSAQPRGGILGVILGLSVLTRPAMLLAAPGILGSVKHSRKALLVACGICLAIFSGWMIRNVHRGVGLTFTQCDAGNLFIGNNAKAVTGGFDKAIAANIPPGATGVAVRWIASHPVQYAKLSLSRAVRIFGIRPDHMLSVQTGMEPYHLLLLRCASAPFQWAAILWGVLNWRRLRPVMLPLISYSIGLILTFANVRYRELFTPMVVVLMADLSMGLHGPQEPLTER